MSKPSIFSNTTVLITGASSGLGEQFARDLARRGAELVLSARSETKLNELAADLARVNGVRVSVVPRDLARPGAALELARDVQQRFTIDHVVNNAGFGSAGHFASSDLEREASMVRVNAEAVVTLSRAFIHGMIERKRGGVLNVASTAAHQPTPFMATYGASKAFVLSFTLALHEELRGSGVRALALCPGPVPTHFQAAANIPSGALLSFAQLDAHVVAEQALDAYEASAAEHVPGVVNGAQALAVKLLPRALVMRATRLAMRKLGRIGE